MLEQNLPPRRTAFNTIPEIVYEITSRVVPDKDGFNRMLMEPGAVTDWFPL